MKRQALYDLVWSVPIDRLAATFEVSGNGMRKVCLRHEIPTPPRGYWAKLRAGKRVERPALPPLRPGGREWVVLAPPSTPYAREGRAWLEEQMALHGYGDESTEVREPIAPQFEADLHVLEWQTLQAIGRVRVKASELQSRRHPSVTTLLEADRAVRQSVWAAQRAVFRGKTPRRRLAFANALLLALEKAGHKGEVGDGQARKLELRVHRQRVAAYLDEKLLPTKQEPQGRLRLDVEVRHAANSYLVRSAWKERRHFVPEEHLARIASGIVVAGELDRRDAEMRFYHEKRQLWQDRLKEQLEREETTRRKAIETLLAQAVSHRKAREIREFVAAASRLNECCPEIATWQAWALEEADRMDPLVAGRRPWATRAENLAPRYEKHYLRMR